MRQERCNVCGSTRPVDCVPPYENIHFGYCPRCGHCLGRYMRDPITKIWDPVPPHCAVGNAYYRESLWGDYYCPRCGRVKERLHVPKKGGSHAEET